MLNRLFEQREQPCSCSLALALALLSGMNYFILFFYKCKIFTICFSSCSFLKFELFMFHIVNKGTYLSTYIVHTFGISKS